MTLLKKSGLLFLGLSISVLANDVCSGIYSAGDFQRAGDCYIGQLKKNKTLMNYFAAGSSLERQGRYKEALPYLKEAEKRANGQDDLGFIYANLSIVCGRLGDAKSRLAYAMKALDIRLKIGEPEGIGTAYSNLGVYYLNNDDNKALEFFTKALEYQAENERAITYQNMAISYDNLNDMVKAEEYYLKAIDITLRQGDYLTLCAEKVNLGIFYNNQNKEEALPMLSDAKDICHKAGDISREADALAWLAYRYYKNGDMATAKEYINRAIPLAKQSGNVKTFKEVNEIYRIITGR